MSPARQGMLLMVAFAALWAAVEALALHFSQGYSPYQVVWTRYAVHLAFMFVVWGRRDPAALWRTRRPAFQWARSLLMLGMPAAFVIAHESGVDTATLLSVFWIAPLFILVLARIFLRERIAPALWLTCTGGCVGAVLVMEPPPFSPSPLLAYPLGMAATFSLYVVMTRSLRNELPHVNLFYTALGVFVALAPFMPHVWVAPTLHDMAVFTAIGLLGLATLYALDRLAALAPVSVTAPLAYVQIPAGVAIGWLLGRHGQDAPAVAGMLIIAAAALFLWARAPSFRIDGGLGDRA